MPACPKVRSVTMCGGGRRARRLASLLVVAGALLAAAPAAQAAPEYRLYVVPNTTAAPGSTLTYRVEVRNVGDADGDPGIGPITFSGTLPSGLTVASVEDPNGEWDCSSVVVGSQAFTCDHEGPVSHGLNAYALMIVHAAVDNAAAGMLTASFAIAGGGAPAPVTTVAPVTITDAPPEFGIAAFDAQVTADADGTPFTQAGGHPVAATTAIDFNTYRNSDPMKSDLTPVEATKDVEVDLPPGFSGDPTTVDQCTVAQLANSQGIDAQPLCSPASQVGTTIVRTNGSRGGHTIFGPLPVFNMVPPPDAPAAIGFNVAGTIVILDVTVRTASDYGLTAHLHNVSEGLAIAGSTVTLWGVPSDPVHDPERSCPGQSGPWAGGPACASGTARTAFLRNPTVCTPVGVGLPTTLRIDSWVHPGDFRERTIFSHLLNGYPFAPADWGPHQGPTGCGSVPFSPSIGGAPDSTVAGGPTGFSFDVSLPQTSDPGSIGQSDLRKAVVTLPAGMHLSASSAEGLQGCSAAQIGLHSDTAPACPAGSKLGTVTITTPALPVPLEGSVYLAAPHENPFDSLVALYLVASGSGVTIKLPARVDLDPLTGQVTTTIDDSPQQPFSNVHVAFKGGSRAPLANPLSCGTYTTHADLTSWSGAIVPAQSSFTITQDGNGAPCPGPRFTPGFTAGTESPAAGTSSPFHVGITRGDGDQELGGLRLDVPEGLTGYISRVPLCGNADANAGTCPEGSKLGSVSVGAGAGPDPFYVTDGRLYLTGPYKGAPYGLSVVVPAVAGPFDLGDVVVRQAVFVDKHTARLTVVSDPLPTILQGVTLGVRDVRVAIDRPGFFLNPTSCAEKHIGGEIDSSAGQHATVSERFQAAECANLGFAPRMVLTVGGRGHTARNRTTPLSTTLTMPARGQANLRFVRVTLPDTINARLTVIGDACTRAQFESDIAKCAHARAGSAVASTPLLRDPLRGSVYFVKNGHPLPDLFVALRGQVSFDLIGRITIPHSRFLQTTFATAPDVPIRSFTLKLFGDPQNGSLGAATNLCSAKARRQKAQLDYIAQNGRVKQIDQALVVRGCATRTAAHRGARRRR